MLCVMRIPTDNRSRYSFFFFFVYLMFKKVFLNDVVKFFSNVEEYKKKNVWKKRHLAFSGEFVVSLGIE